MSSGLFSQNLHKLKQGYIILVFLLLKKQGLLDHTKHGDSQKCILLAAKDDRNDAFYCAAISNDWYTLDKTDQFEIMNEFNHRK